jgi:hypothetical protein
MLLREQPAFGEHIFEKELEKWFEQHSNREFGQRKAGENGPKSGLQ